MPRDSSGNYTLPAGNPVVTGTTIASTWANPTMSDIAQALSDSLDRNGRGGMLAPFQFADGTALAPSITWTNEPTMGFYREDNMDMRAVVGGESVFRWTTGKAQAWDGSVWRDLAYNNSLFLAKDGDINAPGWSWVDEPTTGFYRAGADDVRYAVGGADVFRFSGGEIQKWRDPDWDNYNAQTGVTPSPGDNSTKLATTEYVDNAVAGGGVHAQANIDCSTNPPTSNGAAIGINSYAISGSGYTITLTTPVSNINNAVISTYATQAGSLSTGTTAPGFGKMASTTVVDMINFKTSDNSAVRFAITHFSLWDTGT